MRLPTIAVTGAGGFVGTNLVRHLRTLNRSVIALHRGNEACFAGDAGTADLTRREQVAALIEQGFRADIIVHLAGRVEIALQPDEGRGDGGGSRPGQAEVASLYAANVLGTAHIVDLARASGAQKIVFASSQTVYGHGAAGRANESTPRAPLEHYAASKVCAEILLETASRQGIAVVVLRFPGVFAPTRAAGAVYAMCRSAVREKTVTVDATCAIPFDVLAIEDLLEAMVRAIDFQGEDLEVFNISSGEPCSLELLAERIAAQVPGTRLERRGVRQPSFQMSAERAGRLLNWRSAPLDTRIGEMLAVLRS